MSQTLLLTGLLELPSISGAGEVGGGLANVTAAEAAPADDAAVEAAADAAAVASSCVTPEELAFVDEHPATAAVATARPTKRIFNR